MHYSSRIKIIIFIQTPDISQLEKQIHESTHKYIHTIKKKKYYYGQVSITRARVEPDRLRAVVKFARENFPHDLYLRALGKAQSHMKGRRNGKNR